MKKKEHRWAGDRNEDEDGKNEQPKRTNKKGTSGVDHVSLCNNTHCVRVRAWIVYLVDYRHI